VNTGCHDVWKEILLRNRAVVLITEVNWQEEGHVMSTWPVTTFQL
jgi:hypothetical protein